MGTCKTSSLTMSQRDGRAPEEYKTIEIYGEEFVVVFDWLDFCFQNVYFLIF